MCLPSHCPCHWGLQVLCTELHAYNVPRTASSRAHFKAVHGTRTKSTRNLSRPMLLRRLSISHASNIKVCMVLHWGHESLEFSFSVSVGKLCCASQADSKAAAGHVEDLHLANRMSSIFEGGGFRSRCQYSDP